MADKPIFDYTYHKFLSLLLSSYIYILNYIYVYYSNEIDFAVAFFGLRLYEKMGISSNCLNSNVLKASKE